MTRQSYKMGSFPSEPLLFGGEFSTEPGGDPGTWGSPTLPPAPQAQAAVPSLLVQAAPACGPRPPAPSRPPCAHVCSPLKGPSLPVAFSSSAGRQGFDETGDNGRLTSKGRSNRGALALLTRWPRRVSDGLTAATPSDLTCLCALLCACVCVLLGSLCMHGCAGARARV